MSEQPPEGTAPAAFRLGYVPGATPAKWVRIWRERMTVPLDLVAVEAGDAAAALIASDCDAAILRPPVDRERLRSIALYDERAVVVVSRDHLLAALGAEEEVAPGDLAEDVVLRPLDDALDWPGPLPGRPAVERPATAKDAIELVAAGVGVVVVPQSLARLHHRRDVTYRFLRDAPVAPVVLAWAVEAESDLTQEFIGIVRGRTANSSRGPARGEETGARERGRGPAGSAGQTQPTGGARGQRRGSGGRGSGRARGSGRDGGGSGAGRSGRRGRR